MNICFIGKYVDNITNGVHASTLTLARELAKQGQQVFFYGPSTANESFVDSYHIVHRYYECKWFVPKELEKAILDDVDKIDIYCFQSVFILFNFLVSRVVVRAKKPYIAIPRGGYNINVFKKEKLKKQLYYHLFEKKFLHSATGVICISDSEESTIKGLGYKGYIETTYNPIDAYPETRESYSSDSDSKRIIYLGRFDINAKGIDILLAISKEILKLDKTIQVELYGNGPDKEKMIAQIKNENITNAHVKEPVYGEEKIKVIRSATAYIHTARWEGFGRSIAEAMILGTPCIITQDCNIATDVFKKYDLQLVINHNIKKSACEVVNYLNDRKHLDANAKKSKEVAHCLFKSDNVALKTYNYFQRIITNQI